MGVKFCFSYVVRRLPLLCVVLLSLWHPTSFSGTTQVAEQVATCPSFQFSTTPTTKPPAAIAAAKNVFATLRPGLLQPQVEALIRQGFGVEHIEWRASPHYRWSTDFELTAPTWDLALTKLLRPYQLKLTLFANQTAVIAPRAEVQP